MFSQFDIRFINFNISFTRHLKLITYPLTCNICFYPLITQEQINATKEFFFPFSQTTIYDKLTCSFSCNIPRSLIHRISSNCIPENRIIHWHNSQKRVTRDRHAICNCHTLKVCCQKKKKQKKDNPKLGKVFAARTHAYRIWLILTTSIIKLFFFRHIFLKIVYFVSIMLHEKMILFPSDTLALFKISLISIRFFCWTKTITVSVNTRAHTQQIR